MCKGLCQQLDSLQICMGICSTDPDFAQSTYDRHKDHAIKTGGKWTPIEYFENRTGVSPSPEVQAVPVNVQQQRPSRQ